MGTEVGGTWRQNIYPGAECDIPSHLYSLSFELNPNWPKHYSGQREIYAYLQHVAKKYNVYKQILFNTEVLSTEWLDDRQKWHVKWRSTRDEKTDIISESYFDAVIAGLGPLRIPNVPKEFSGFEGPIVHTTFWDESVDFTNKRVAVIGSGTSAVQVIPELTKQVSHLYNYMRTPIWVVPRDQFNYSSLVKFIFRYVPFAMRLYRWFLYLKHEVGFGLFRNHQSRLSRKVRSQLQMSIVQRLKKVGRLDLVPALTPEYAPGCKRLAKSETFIEALAKPNVTLVRDGIAQVKGRTIIDNQGNEVEVDILVLATGFKTQSFTGNLKVIGRGGQTLDDKWHSAYPQTYKSVTTPGYPNFFYLLGPSSGLGHNSVIVIVECQVEYAVQCLKHMVRNSIKSLEPKESAADEWVSTLREKLKTTVWGAGGCQSWYQNDEGEVFGLWSGNVTSYWRALRRPDFDHFIAHK
ncbi:putative monooxygenase [Syncephalastrum racemosum]|uniref:Putative monooxygenase n=1 Tax=Syncephalastrum racemosum TaxID=13706 RepID=A0A1X2HM07_SYNRA|nr:putative monooxygenase [Syncephalastrum racemosum]